MRAYDEDFDDLDFADSVTVDRMMRSKKRKPGHRHASHKRNASRYTSGISSEYETDFDFDEDFDSYDPDEFDSYAGFSSRYAD